MGDTRSKRKLYARPRKLYDRQRIDEENIIVKKYGLKNKTEIWKAKSAVSKLRRQAKTLIGKDMAEQTAFFEKLNKLGLNITDISDVLALTESNLLERRLQTFVVKQGLANTPKQARQMIVHKKILIAGNIVNIPSYLVTKELEKEISIKPTPIKETPIQETVEEQTQEELAPEATA